MKRIGCVVMASGRGERFGGNKLLAPFCGETLVGFMLKKLPMRCFERVVVATRWREVAEIAARAGFECAVHDDPRRSASLRLGLARMTDVDGVLFRLADQPLCAAESVKRMCARFQRDPERIVRLAWRGEAGSPVLFPASLFPELMGLTGEQGGGAVIARHPELVQPVEAEHGWEMMDVDVPEALAALERIASRLA